MPCCRYHNVLFPVTNYVCELLPDTARDSSRLELYYEDLDKLQPEEVDLPQIPIIHSRV